MIRRFGSGKLSSGQADNEDVNPMDSLSNLADAMLVLAVGIMLALVINWKIDIGKVVDVDELNNVKNLDNEQVEKTQQSDGLQEKGVVYQDPETGKYYVQVQKK